ncbi:maestro heat-like repeat-containing protein family member 6 [Vidua chalybeata]|uniref:maestro heat-like repeat-containing protein family member 6 n=1 Tax=Vidua chalybeata TaxID=81927 RepID=UPI0023A79A59|nr:maestro heat-like repeat-containing protein family member 6 [Vidua chalybeata]XP_053803588.1 maestro heat-like repeat-containing protein family member 6 [Vidua chalybeata]
MFRQFLRIQRRKTGSTAAAGAAEPDSGLTGLQAEPDGNPDSAERSEESATSETETWAKAHLMSMTEDVAIRNTKTRETQGLTNTGTMPAPTMIHAPTMDFFEESAVPSHQQQQVPAKVKNIHQSLMSHVSVDARLQTDIVRLAEEHPADVVLTLLRCAPTCDRAAAMMWRAIGSSGPALENALPTLLCVMEDWPLHRMCTSDGDNKDVFALAATLVIWLIVQVPECHETIVLYSSRLFVALLSHLVITTQQMPPEEVDNFWRACGEERRLPSKPNRFAVQAMKALLCRLQCDHVVVAMERKRGWDTLLCAHTQHYAVGLLARKMLRVLIPLCSRIALHLLRQLSREEPCWDLPALAFLVEVLERLDMSKCGGSVLKIMSRYLRSECSQRRRLALRGLVVPSKDPSMARRMCSVSQSLLELLGDEDREVVSMSLHVFTNVLQHKDILVSSTTAPKLAEALLLLFDHDNSHVQLLSIQLFCKVIDLVVDEGKKPLETIVNKSLDTLFIYCHDENWHVAKASRETLHCAAKFLNRRDLEQLLEKENLWKFAEVLLAEDRSRAAEHLRRARPYLQSPQEPLREAAVRFMGMAERSSRGQQGELQLLCNALQARRQDASPSCSNLENQAQFPQRPKELGTPSGSSEPVSQEHTRRH